MGAAGREGITTKANDAVPGTRFDFAGRGGEYFRIWIVNVFLTIVTLGIYSAWAKVRRTRYLYGSTLLEGAAFDYLANPIAILKGRLIAVGLLMVYGASELVSPILQGALALAFLPVLPWLVIRARRFTLRNTAYRNIRFDFTGHYGEALVVYILCPLMIAFSMFLLYPLYVWQRAKFLVENSTFGTQEFTFTVGMGAYFLAYLKFLALFGTVLVAGGLGFGNALAASSSDSSPALALLVLFVTMLALLATLSYKHVTVTNLTWSGIELSGMRTRCVLETPQMYWIALTNLVAIVASFGLLIPWATIRMARYRIEHISLLNPENLDALLGTQTAQIGAAGEEIGEFLGIDIGL